MNVADSVPDTFSAFDAAVEIRLRAKPAPKTTAGSPSFEADALTHFHIRITDGSLHVPVSSHRIAVSSLQESETMHNTTLLIDGFDDLFDIPLTHGVAIESANSVQHEKVVSRKRFEWHRISIFARPSSRRRRNGQSFVPGEILEKRQLLSDDPITEMNSQWNLGIGTSNAQIDAFFNSGSTGAAGGLNGALAGAAAKFNQLPLNGYEIEDSAIQDVSTKFGTAESEVSSSMNSIKSSRPVIAFPESFGIGTPFQMPMMMMPGMQMGSRGYSYVNVLTGDYYGTSNFIVEVPSSTPGILTSRLALQGTVNRSNGVVTSNLCGDYMKNEPAQNVSYHIEIVNPGSANGKILKFNASQTIGAITTNASVDILDGVTNYYSFGGSGNFGDITTSFSKSKMYQTERLFGQIEYLSGNTKASAQLTQITSTNANVTAAKGLFSYLEGQPGVEKYLQVGVGAVTGTVSGQSINESFGGIALGMPVKRPWWLPLAPSYIVVQQGWHNTDNWGAPPALMSSPPAINQGTLFLRHENMKSDIWGHVDQYWGGLQFSW